MQVIFIATITAALISILIKHQLYGTAAFFVVGSILAIGIIVAQAVNRWRIDKMLKRSVPEEEADCDEE